MDAYTFEWQLGRFFGVWKSAVQQISDWIQTTGTHRSRIVLVKVHVVILYSFGINLSITYLTKHMDIS